MKLAIFDTEGLGEAIDDYAEATGSDPVVFGAAWAKAKGLSHGSPDALIAAMRECEKDPEIFALLVDSATDVAHYERKAYKAKNPGKKPPYDVVDAKAEQVVGQMKAFTKHLVLTFREKDDKGPVDGQEQVLGKRGKAAADMEYLCRVKCHCTKTGTKTALTIACEVQDQRGLGDKPSTRLVKPTSQDFTNLLALERYRTKPERKIHAHFYGREGTGKSGCAMRLLMALQRVLQTTEEA